MTERLDYEKRKASTSTIRWADFERHVKMEYSRDLVSPILDETGGNLHIPQGERNTVALPTLTGSAV